MEINDFNKLKSTFHKEKDLYTHKKISENEFKKINEELNNKILKASKIDLNTLKSNFDNYNDLYNHEKKNLYNYKNISYSEFKKINERRNEELNYKYSKPSKLSIIEKLKATITNCITSSSTISPTYNLNLNDNNTRVNVAYDHLFVEDTVTTTNYTSLDIAFKLQ